MFKRTNKLRLSIIKQIEIEAAKYPNVISLAQGIPSFDTPACIKRRVENALNRGVVAKYSLSPGLPELRELVEYSLTQENMYYDWQKEIIITAGSIEGLTATILTLTNPGDEILIPEPTYTSYREVIVLAGCKPIFVPLNEEAGWTLEIDKYEQLITEKTKAILYCNPNNPTGTIYTKKQLLGLAKLAKKHNLYLISDEVYKDLIDYDKKEITGSIFSLAEIKELRHQVIRLFSFSKAYAMTGWRVGYLHSDEKNIKEILKVHDCLVTCAPVISQYAAMGALEMGKSDINFFWHEYRKRRDLVCQRLDKLNKIFSYVKPNSSYFVFPKIKTTNDSWTFSLNLLKEIQTAVVPGMAFGPSGEGHIRINFGRDAKTINEAFDRMDEYFK